MIDYNDDWTFDINDINLITYVIDNSDFNCWSWKVCDFVNVSEEQFTSADIWFLVHILKTWEFLELPESIYTLEDFCPTRAPYPVSVDPCFLSQLDYDNNGVVDKYDWRWVYNNVWNWSQVCPTWKICSFEYYGQCKEEFTLADTINLWYFIIWHTTLDDFKEQIGLCHEVGCSSWWADSCGEVSYGWYLSAECVSKAPIHSYSRYQSNR